MMTCAQFEILYADYLDGTLTVAERAKVDQHLESCASCRVLAQEIASAATLLRSVPEPEVPADLITKIAYQAPQGRVRDQFDRQSFFERTVGRWLQPILQPRLVMGMAMTVLSFAMLERCTGVKVQHIQAADLSPVRIWGGVENKTLRARDRVVKYYENLRWVYEIETRLRTLQDQQGAESDKSQPPAQTDKQENGEAK
jgi:anti-sigma factor RsiW